MLEWRKRAILSLGSLKRDPNEPCEFSVRTFAFFLGGFYGKGVEE